VHNPELHLATLNAKGKLEMELTVERGRGLRLCRPEQAGDAEIGRVPVDSIYSPVLKVTYKVEATRVEQRTDFDRLVVDVETSGRCSRATRWRRPARRWSSCSAWPRELNVEAEGIDMGPSPTTPLWRGPGAADRGAGPDRPVLQLLKREGHPHRG